MQGESITVEVLREVVTRACEQWPQSKGRIERGAMIALMGGVEQLDSSTWLVQSQTEPGQAYRVVDVPLSCECPDQPNRAPGGYCKHIWAVDLLSMASKRQRWAGRRQQRASGDRVALAVAAAARAGWRP